MFSRFVTHPPRLYRLLFGEAVWRVPVAGQPTVYLTFDDGPVPGVTPQVLDILDRHNAKATFFMVGDNVRRFPELLNEVRRRGHAVGNHTMHHMQSLHNSRETFLHDIDEADALLNSQLFRPPHGLMKPSHIRAVRASKRLIMYDIVTRDYACNIDADGVVDNVLRHVQNGSIIVMHDSRKAARNMLPALPRVIDALRARGFAFATLE